MRYLRRFAAEALTVTTLLIPPQASAPSCLRGLAPPASADEQPADKIRQTIL